MTNLLQEYLAAATRDAAADLAEYFMWLPIDKHLWRPSETTRPALRLVAECVSIIGYAADALQAWPGRDRQKWPGGRWNTFQQEVALAVALGWDDHLLKLLSENAKRAAFAVAAVPPEALGDTAEWWAGSMPMTQIMGYPLGYINRCSGKIIYIASLLQSRPV